MADDEIKQKLLENKEGREYICCRAEIYLKRSYRTGVRSLIQVYIYTKYWLTYIQYLCPRSTLISTSRSYETSGWPFTRKRDRQLSARGDSGAGSCLLCVLLLTQIRSSTALVFTKKDAAAKSYRRASHLLQEWRFWPSRERKQTGAVCLPTSSTEFNGLKTGNDD